MKNLYERYKNKAVIIGLIIIGLSLIAQVVISVQEKMKEEHLSIPNLEWSEKCDGKTYTEQEKQDFCNACLNRTGTCDWPLDMIIRVENAETIIKTGGEVHCYQEIDGINYYQEKGRYYGITEKELFTWEVIDASKPHEVTFCCWIERKNIATLFSIEQNMPIACTTRNTTPRCTS